MARRDLVQVTVDGRTKTPGQLVRDFDREERKIRDTMNATMRNLDRFLPGIYQAEAPVDTGRLRDSITSRIAFTGRFVRITVAAEAVRGGFDYYAVSRFGHASAVIRPARRRAMTVFVRGRHSKPILRRRVRAYRPRVDWVEQATREAQAVVDVAVRRMGRDIDVVLLTSGRA